MGKVRNRETDGKRDGGSDTLLEVFTFKCEPDSAASPLKDTPGIHPGLDTSQSQDIMHT